MCLESKFKASWHQAGLNGYVSVYYFEVLVHLYGVKGTEGMGGWKALLVAPDRVSCLFCALPDPSHADLYSEHPPNKCQSIKGGNVRSALGTLSYTEKGIAFVSLWWS